MMITANSVSAAVEAVQALHPGAYVWATDLCDGYDVLIWDTEAEAQDDDGAHAIARYRVEREVRG